MSEARRITAALNGRWYGRYGLACCPAHADTNPSLSISDSPSGQLLLHCKAGCSFRDVLDALRWKGIVEGSGRMLEPDPAELARARAEAERQAAKKEQRALACWKEALPITGTPAETYLRARAIICELPDSLRYHPCCWHPSGARLPAMVARVDDAERYALHRTFIQRDGSWTHGDKTARGMLGSTTGGHVHLTDGPEGGPLVIAEGIETALSLACGLLREPATIWASLSTAGMASLILPSGEPHRLIIATDGDAPGKDAGSALAERAATMGWNVSTLPAPDGRDWNDVLVLAAKRKDHDDGHA